MTNAKEIAATFRAHGLPMAQFNPTRGQWAANSQYGYALSFHESRRGARCAVIQYYLLRHDLITQGAES